MPGKTELSFFFVNHSDGLVEIVVPGLVYPSAEAVVPPARQN